MKPKNAHIVSQQLTSSACPNCQHELSGVTGVRFDGFFQPPALRLKGEPTLCTYCGALLIFVDDSGLLRAMTEGERNSVRYAPYAQKLVDEWRRKISAERAQAAVFKQARDN